MRLAPSKIKVVREKEMHVTVNEARPSLSFLGLPSMLRPRLERPRCAHHGPTTVPYATFNSNRAVDRIVPWGGGKTEAPPRS